MSDASNARLCKSGTWLRQGSTGYVFITCQNWDYYFDEYTDGEPDLGPDGFAYYVLYGDSSDWMAARSRSPTCLTESEAVDRAEALVGPIKWFT